MYSVFVNEKDFIPIESTQTLTEMFPQPIKFGFNAKLQRPENFRLGYEDKIKDGLIEQQNPALYRYTQSVEENFPGVYQYYVSISLLPFDFQAGADNHRLQTQSAPTLIPEATDMSGYRKDRSKFI